MVERGGEDMLERELCAVAWPITASNARVRSSSRAACCARSPVLSACAARTANAVSPATTPSSGIVVEDELEDAGCRLAEPNADDRSAADPLADEKVARVERDPRCGNAPRTRRRVSRRQTPPASVRRRPPARVAPRARRRPRRRRARRAPRSARRRRRPPMPRLQARATVRRRRHQPADSCPSARSDQRELCRGELGAAALSTSENACRSRSTSSEPTAFPPTSIGALSAKPSARRPLGASRGDVRSRELGRQRRRPRVHGARGEAVPSASARRMTAASARANLARRQQRTSQDVRGPNRAPPRAARRSAPGSRRP